MFPVVQVVQQLISDYDVMKGDQRTPTGEPKYPLGLGERALRTMGVSTKTGTGQDSRNGEKRRVIGVFKDLERNYPRMDPEQREAAREYIKDYTEGYFKKFKAAR
jgi:hypothetical protein